MMGVDPPWGGPPEINGELNVVRSEQVDEGIDCRPGAGLAAIVRPTPSAVFDRPRRRERGAIRRCPPTR